LDQIRQAGQQLLAVTDEIIRRTLSGDSPTFVRSSQQEGGQ
jgi:hypothetical protein